MKNVFLKILQNLLENSFFRVSFLTKLQESRLQLCQKRESDTGFSLWIIEISKTNFFIKNLRATASDR